MKSIKIEGGIVCVGSSLCETYCVWSCSPF